MTLKPQLLLLFLLLGICFQFSACGKNSTGLKSKGKVAPEFAGHWESEEGSWLTLDPSGRGDFSRGEVRMVGAAVDAEESEIKFSVFGTTETFQVEAGPKDKEEFWAMTLDGVEYRRYK